MFGITKEKAQKFITSGQAKFATIVAVASGVAGAVSSVTASADEVGVTYFQVTESMVQPVVSAINSGLTVMVPIGVTCMASFIGINVVKRVIYSFI